MRDEYREFILRALVVSSLACAGLSLLAWRLWRELGRCRARNAWRSAELVRLDGALADADEKIRRHAMDTDALDRLWRDRYRELLGQYCDADETDAGVDAAVKRVHAEL